MNAHVLVVGSINIDQVLSVERHPVPGETITASDPRLLPGGKGANQAVAAALQGASVSMVGAVGTADAGVALAALEDAGVDLGGVEKVDGTTGLAIIMVAADGENTVTVTAGANAQVSPELVERGMRLQGASAVCVVQGELPPTSTDRAVALAQELGVRAVVNAAPVSDLARATLLAANPLVVNEHEGAAALAALGGTAREQDGSVAAAQEVCDELVRAGVPSVVITLGGDGVVGHDGPSASDGDSTWHLPARPAKPVDTTGAGDAFVGALAARLAAGARLREAAEHANRVAAYSVERHGTQGSYPTSRDPLP